MSVGKAYYTTFSIDIAKPDINILLLEVIKKKQMKTISNETFHFKVKRKNDFLLKLSKFFSKRKIEEMKKDIRYF